MREFKKLPLELFIGYDIEQNSRVIELDASEMVEKYPSGILQLVCKRPGEETTYIAPSFEQDGGTLRWTLTSYDVEKAGQGLAIVALVDTSEKSVKVLASHKIRTGIEEGLHFRDAEKVDPDDSLIARVLAAVSQAQAYAQDAKKEADRAGAALDDVGGAKDQAISDIEAKGQETRASIPQDYTALSGDVSDLKSAIAQNNNVTFPNSLVGIEANVYYKIDPPIKVGESFTVSNPSGVATTRFIDYEWYNINKERINGKRYYAGTISPSTIIVSGEDVHYFRWLNSPPPKILKVERGDTATAYKPFFKTYEVFAPDMSVAQDIYKQSFLYPDSFTNHFLIIASNGSFDGINTSYNTTNLIPLNSGDVVHYNLCAYSSSEGVLAVFDRSGAFISCPAVGTDRFTMVEGTYTAEQDCYVVATHRFTNVQNEQPYFYINDSVLYKAHESVSKVNALAETFVSGYGILDGWETHAEAFSKLMADVNETEGFMFITDSHFMSKTNDTWKPYAYKIFSYLEKLYYSSPCSFVLHGGDWLGTGEAREDYLYKLSAINGAFRRNFDKFALLVGNHECGNQSAEGTMFTHDTLANTLLANVGKTYYKYNANTFSMYCFDSWQSGALDSFANEQIAWFAQSLEAETAKHIVIAVHMLYDSDTLTGIGDELTKCASAYNSRGAYTYNNNAYSFTSATGKVGFVIAGHEHSDKTGTVNNIPYIITTNLTGYGGESTFNNLPLPVDLMKVDWNNSTLTAYRATRGKSGTTRTLSIIA